ncbi:phage tail length tape measure family protein [Nitratireductor aquibiodomus]|uniref:phage tail length tape measure family protein n=1 Tax=Nitratireductor aquibiodomus TaxID=204799 RepID=UPI0019D3B689|nr:phage tail length tape measure family protein [Nitratireductor aquibiodomus]MBN7763399.1 phage tail length tape measure family protein [Nitratireductor aquibiodomus]
MAITADKVVTILEAKTEAYDAKISNSAKQFEAKMAKISAAAEKAGKATSLIGTNAVFDRFAPQAAAAATGLNSIAASGNMAQMQMRNLAFQFQDIGTMLAAGQSPFMLLAQQLPQVTMYGGSLNGVMGALRGTIASLFSPLGLATTAFVLLGSAAVSYFSDVLAQSDDSEEALKRQSDLIKRVADRWGDAAPALKEYVDQLEREQALAERSEANRILLNKAWAETRGAIDEVATSTESLLAELLNIGSGATVQQITELRNSFSLLEGKIRDGEASTQDIQAVQAALADIMNNTSNPAVAALAKQYETLADSIARANGEAERAENQLFEGIENRLDSINEANKKYVEDAERRQSLTAEQLRLENEIARVRAEAERGGGFLTVDEATEIATGNIAADDRRRPARKTPGGRVASISDAEREKQAVIDLIAQLEFERSLIGMTAVEREKANALRRAGSAATDEQREKIGQLVEATYNENAALQAQQQAYRELEQIGMNAINSIADAFKDGKLDANEMINIVIQLIQQLMTMKSLGGGMGLFGGLFGGGGISSAAMSAVMGGAGGLYDKGGYTGPGGKYQPAGVVHKGEYVFSKAAVDKIGVGNLEAMHRNLKGYAEGGFVAPSAPPMRMASQAPGSVYAPQYNIDASGAEAGVETKISAALKEYDKGNYQRFLSNMGNARKRNAI